MKVKFLGTNGGYCSDTGYTPSILIECKEQSIVLDAGAGLMRLYQLGFKEPISIFLTHFHYDHISSLHAIKPFRFKNGIDVYGQEGLEKTIRDFMKPPFTMTPEELGFPFRMHELTEGSHDVNGLKISCYLLNHRDPCYGYRIEEGKKSIAYCTDTGLSDNAIKLSKSADLLIHDCSFKQEILELNWPHSTPTVAAEIAKKSKAKKLILTHFVPFEYPTQHDRNAAKLAAKDIFKNTHAAFDLMELSI